MTKIIIVGPASPLRGGISDFNEALAKSFYEKNIKIEIVSFSLQYPKILFLENLKTEQLFLKVFLIKYHH